MQSSSSFPHLAASALAYLRAIHSEFDGSRIVCGLRLEDTGIILLDGVVLAS